MNKNPYMPNFPRHPFSINAAIKCGGKKNNQKMGSSTMPAAANTMAKSTLKKAEIPRPVSKRITTPAPTVHFVQAEC
ncbi:MAG: hypothetical protein PHI11_15190 [Gallionella sp.]|nr:hypothetical protein [Gallionella sp.]